MAAREFFSHKMTDMKRDEMRKRIGRRVRLQPAAIGPLGRSFDDDWLVTDVTETVAMLRNVRTNAEAIVGLDAVYSYFFDPARSTPTEEHGFLQLLAQVQIGTKGAVTVTPIPPPRTAGAQFPADQFHPLVLADHGSERYFSWSGRDPVHLAADQGTKFLKDSLLQSLVHALRVETAREPRLERSGYVSGERIYELSPDFRARWSLVGGVSAGGRDMVLVLTEKPARFPNGDEKLSSARPCSCGRGQVTFAETRNRLAQLLATNKLRYYCIMCDGWFELTESEKNDLRRRI